MWWYMRGTKRIGPITADEVAALFYSEKISEKTLVWKEGITEWQPVNNIEDFKTFFDKPTPPSPPRINFPALPAGLIRRYFARSIDIGVSQILSSIIMLFVLGSLGLVSSEFWVMVIIYIVFIPSVAMFIDGAIYGIFGNTIGKKIFSIVVKERGDKKLDAGAYLVRNYRLLRDGLALGIPILSFGTVIWQAVRIRNGELSTYDKKCNTQVYGLAVGAASAIGYSALLLIIFGVLSMGSNVSQNYFLTKVFVSKNNPGANKIEIENIKYSAKKEKMEAFITSIESKYPEFDPKSKDFDQALVDRVLYRQKVLINSGKDEYDSLAQAVEVETVIYRDRVRSK